MQKTIKILAPIYEYGLILKNPLSLDENVIIRPLSCFKKEHELIKNELHLSPIKYSNVAEIKYNFDPQNSYEPYPNLELTFLNKIEVALRIFHKGIVGFAGIISKPKVSPFPLVLSRVTPVGENKYKIKDDKLNRLSGFYQKFKLAYQKKQIAFNWFNKSYFEVPVNKVIDYCICLENLFVPSRESRKKSFILQGLTLLNIDKLSKDKIEILIDYRNAIVHADLSNQNEILRNKIRSMFEFMDNCEEILRKILQIYIEKQW